MSGFVGVDFGTSNCAAAAMLDGLPSQIRLDGDQDLLASVLYVDKADSKPLKVDQQELRRRVAAVQAGRAGMVAEETIERRERAALVREMLQNKPVEEASLSVGQLLLGATSVEIGEQAIRSRIRNPMEGVYFKSPKRFLGSDLRAAQREVFQRVVSIMLTHIRQQCEQALDGPVHSAVLGRPVTYSDIKGEEGNVLALGTMRAAALDAGFEDIVFMMEPVAAALEFERTLRRETTVLVVDVGGGTTDCSVVRLGPLRSNSADRSTDVLSSVGVRYGGVDIDEGLAWKYFSPLLGRDLLQKNGRPMPYTLFHQAMSVHDLPSQTQFYGSEKVIADLVAGSDGNSQLQRLLRVCTGRLTNRLIRSAELTKIGLTDEASVASSLDYVDDDLRVQVDRTMLGHAAERVLEKLVTTATEAIRLAGKEPEVVFVTGGTARSPVVEAAIRGALGQSVTLVIGDLFGSVASGLALHAAQVFGPTARS